MKVGKSAPVELDQSAVIVSLRRELAEHQAEFRALRDQLEGKQDSIWWVQRKVWLQRQALDVLNRRVVSQRFVLRTLNEMGRGLSVEEYRAARQAVQNEQLRERIDEEPVAV